MMMTWKFRKLQQFLLNKYYSPQSMCVQCNSWESYFCWRSCIFLVTPFRKTLIHLDSYHYSMLLSMFNVSVCVCCINWRDNHNRRDRDGWGCQLWRGGCPPDSDAEHVVHLWLCASVHLMSEWGLSFRCWVSLYTETTDVYHSIPAKVCKVWVWGRMPTNF